MNQSENISESPLSEEISKIANIYGIDPKKDQLLSNIEKIPDELNKTVTELVQELWKESKPEIIEELSKAIGITSIDLKERLNRIPPKRGRPRKIAV